LCRPGSLIRPAPCDGAYPLDRLGACRWSALRLPSKPDSVDPFSHVTPFTA